MGLWAWLKKKVRRREWVQDALERQFPEFAEDRPAEFHCFVLLAKDYLERIRDPAREVEILNCRTLEGLVAGRMILNADYHRYYNQANAYTRHGST